MIPEIFSFSFSNTLTIPIYSFGLMMLLCFVGAMKLLELTLADAGLSKDLAEPIVTHAAIGGIVGARIFSIFSNLEALMNDPLGVIFSTAGFVFYGGFIGGLVGVGYFLKKSNLNFLRFTNIVSAPLAFGYAIGRLGCQLSGDGDYGTPSELPWAMNYALGVIPTEIAVHPTPVYESLFAIFLTLLLRSRFLQTHFSFEGQLFGVYLVASSISRFLVEIIRVEPRLFMNFSQAQIISIPLLILGLYFVIRPFKKSSGEMHV